MLGFGWGHAGGVNVRVVVPLLLLVAGLAVGALALSSYRSADADEARADELEAAAAFVPFAEEAADGRAPTTPLLTARRVPARLVEPASRAALAQRLQQVVDDSPPNTCLVVSEDGEDLFVHQNDLPVVPASTMKLVTALTVLDAFGDDHVFTTEVRGDVGDGGVVAGDLWLVGGGDPLLSTAEYIDGFEEPLPRHSRLEDLADAAVAAGVTEVRGAVVGDETSFDRDRYVDAWPERFATNNQSGPLSALLVNDGFVDFPSNGRRQALSTAVGDPASHAAGLLTQLLAERGVAVQGAPRSGVANPDVAVVAQLESLPLSEIVAQMLTRSDNTTAEVLVKNLGVLVAGTGSTAAGNEASVGVLEEAGLSVDGVVLDDGSGLAGTSRLTCGLLENLLEETGATSTIADGLAVAGETGTLRNRFGGTPVQGRMRAKTGTLNQTTALAGFVTTEQERELVFAYVANDDFITGEIIRLQDELGAALVDYPQGPDLALLGPA